jgi:bla regulator protein BlaR1
MSALLSALVFKGSILMIAAAAAVALLYRASAATRHFVWTLAVAGLLLLPALSATLPTWQIALPLLPADVGVSMDAVRGVVAAPAAAPALAAPLSPIIGNPSQAMTDGVPWVMVFVAIYVLGVLLLLGRLAVQQSQARRIAREATVITDADWTSLLDDCVARIGVVRRVILRRSREQLMPMTMGMLKPSVVVPADADAWDEDRRRAVLLHELAHISRHDCLTQMLSAMACALYWVHPGTWYVARRLRIEREVACDDRVLVAGAHARDYAGHLLELAYTWSGRRAPALAVGMAGSRKLEGRMRAVLDPQRNRTTPTRRLWLAGAGLTAAVLLAIAGVRMTTTTASADVRGTLMSSSRACRRRVELTGSPARGRSGPDEHLNVCRCASRQATSLPTARSMRASWTA